MIRKRHMEEQIILVPKDAQSGPWGPRALPKARHLGGRLLEMAYQACGAGSQRGEEAAPAGRRKRAVETDGDRASAGHPGAEGDHRTTQVEPKAKRTAAQRMAERRGLSQPRVYRLLKLDRTTLRYGSRCQEDVALRMRICEIAESKRRYGCPRSYVRLRREGWFVNHQAAGSGTAATGAVLGLFRPRTRGITRQGAG